jgi:hypothetical protein
LQREDSAAFRSGVWQVRQLANEHGVAAAGHKLVTRHTGQCHLDTVTRLGRCDVAVVPGKVQPAECLDRLVQCGHSHRIADLVEHPAHHGAVTLFVAGDARLRHPLA